MLRPWGPVAAPVFCVKLFPPCRKLTLSSEQATAVAGLLVEALTGGEQPQGCLRIHQGGLQRRGERVWSEPPARRYAPCRLQGHATEERAARTPPLLRWGRRQRPARRLHLLHAPAATVVVDVMQSKKSLTASQRSVRYT